MVGGVGTAVIFVSTCTDFNQQSAAGELDWESDMITLVGGRDRVAGGRSCGNSNVPTCVRATRCSWGVGCGDAESVAGGRCDE